MPIAKGPCGSLRIRPTTTRDNADPPRWHMSVGAVQLRLCTWGRHDAPPRCFGGWVVTALVVPLSLDSSSHLGECWHGAETSLDLTRSVTARKFRPESAFHESLRVAPGSCGHATRRRQSYVASPASARGMMRQLSSMTLVSLPRSNSPCQAFTPDAREFSSLRGSRDNNLTWLLSPLRVSLLKLDPLAFPTASASLVCLFTADGQVRISDPGLICPGGSQRGRNEHCQHLLGLLSCHCSLLGGQGWEAELAGVEARSTGHGICGHGVGCVV